MFEISDLIIFITVRKVFKYGVFSGPYFPAFGLNTEYLSVFRPNAPRWLPQSIIFLKVNCQSQITAPRPINEMFFYPSHTETLILVILVFW